MLITQFKEYLKAKNLSKVSQKNYVSDSRRFLLWHYHAFNLKTKTPFEISLVRLIDGSTLATYRSKLIQTKTPLKTINRYLGSLRLFGLFLKTSNLKITNPSSNLINVTQEGMDPVNPELGLNNDAKTNKTYQNQAKLGQNTLSSFKLSLINQHLSRSTVKNYISDVGQFLNWLKTND